MTYTEFRSRIHLALSASPEGLTWPALRDKLRLPYDRPCPAWVQRLEEDIHLQRARPDRGPAVWSLAER